MKWLNKLLKALSQLPEVTAVAAADDTGTYISGVNVDDADEFSAILTCVGRSGVTLEEVLGLDELQCISISGMTSKLYVHKLQDFFVGVRVKGSSKNADTVESSINTLISTCGKKN